MVRKKPRKKSDKKEPFSMPYAFRDRTHPQTIEIARDTAVRNASKTASRMRKAEAKLKPAFSGRKKQISAKELAWLEKAAKTFIAERELAIESQRAYVKTMNETGWVKPSKTISSWMDKEHLRAKQILKIIEEYKKAGKK